MGECIKLASSKPESCGDVLTEMLRKGAHTLLQQAVEAEVQTYLEKSTGPNTGKMRSETGIRRSGRSRLASATSR